jgi:hypothetical protein
VVHLGVWLAFYLRISLQPAHLAFPQKYSNDFIILINGSPEIMLFTSNLHRSRQNLASATLTAIATAVQYPPSQRLANIWVGRSLALTKGL